MIIQAAVTCSDLKNIYTNIARILFAILVTLTSKTTDALALNFLQTLFRYYKGNSLKDF